MNSNRVGIFVIPNHIIFAPEFLLFKIIFALSIFKNVVFSKVFTLTFFCAIPQRASVGEMWRPTDGEKDVKSPCTGSIWDYGSDGYLWVHTTAIINISPRPSALSISTTLVPISLSSSNRFDGVENGWLNILLVLKGYVIPTDNFSDPAVWPTMISEPVVPSIYS